MGKAEIPKNITYITPVKLPLVRIESINLCNLKAFENYTMDFSSSGAKHGVKEFVCLIGPNGTGKSTILHAIQMLFGNYEGRELDRLRMTLGTNVRHVEKRGGGTYGDEDFLLTARIKSENEDYEVQINKSGFAKPHPDNIKPFLYRMCYTASFDQNLRKFQLAKNKWPIFKKLYEAITGFVVEENPDIEKYLGGTDVPGMKNLIENYVLAFDIHKPHEIIHQKECSDGESKIIKCFSTMLNLEFTPQIILIDNIEMHVDRRRHIALIGAMKECYPDSQIFSTTHSYYVSRVMGSADGVYDLRLVHADNLIKEQPWRLNVIDEIDDALIKISALDVSGDAIILIENGKNLIDQCYKEIKDLQKFHQDLENFLKEVPRIFAKSFVPKHLENY